MVEAENVKVLVVGGSGFIGSHLVSALLREGYTVKIADIKKPEVPQHRKLWSFLDVSEPNFNIRKYDVIYHLAHVRFRNIYSYDMKVDFEPHYKTNVAGTYNLLRNMNPDALLVYLSSIAVYGNAQNINEPSNEKSPLNIDLFNPYAYCKLMGEHLVEYCASKYLIFRLSTVMGEGGYTFPNKLVYSAVHGNLVEVYYNGLATRNYLDIRDAVSALLMFPTLHVNQTYNVGSPKPIFNAHLVMEVFDFARKRGYSLNCKFVDHAPLNYIQYSSVDSGKIRSFGWQPKISLQNSIQRLFQFYVEGGERF